MNYSFASCIVCRHWFRHFWYEETMLANSELSGGSRSMAFLRMLCAFSLLCFVSSTYVCSPGRFRELLGRDSNSEPWTSSGTCQPLLCKLLGISIYEVLLVIPISRRFTKRPFMLRVICFATKQYYSSPHIAPCMADCPLLSCCRLDFQISSVLILPKPFSRRD